MNGKLFSKVSSYFVPRSIFRVAVPLVLALVLVSYSRSEDHDNYRGFDNYRGPDNHPDLVGTWVTNARLSIIPPGFPGDGAFQALNTYNSDGTLQVVSQIPGVTIGSGVWKQTGRDRYTFSFTFYRTDPSSPSKMLPVLVNENVKMTGENSYITTDTIRPLDGNGQPLLLCGGICDFPGTVKGLRYQLAHYNTLVP